MAVAVTLLTDFETCSHPFDWTLDTHGIRMSFKTPVGRYGACYLPDVATEQGWDQEETMVSLMRKAGWRGPSDKWREVKELKVVRYKGKARHLEYRAYKEFREWVDEQNTNKGKGSEA